MEKESRNKCERCKKSFATKYTLKNHLESKICENRNDSVLCISLKCSYKALSRSDLQKHLKICKYIETDLIVNKLTEEHKKEIETYNKKIEELNKEHKTVIDHLNNIINIKEEYIKNDNERMLSLLEKMISKPIITTNNNS